MIPNYKIYLICYYNGKPLDFLLPVYTDAQFSAIKESAGTCFKIGDAQNAEIVLACRKDEEWHLARFNIESACKSNSNISFSIVVNQNDNSAYLRAFTDGQHNALYPIPQDFMDKARVD